MPCRVSISALSSPGLCSFGVRYGICRAAIRHLSSAEMAMAMAKSGMVHAFAEQNRRFRLLFHRSPGTSIFQNIHDKSSACQDVQNDATIYQSGQKICQVFIGHCVNLSYWSQARNGLAHPLLKVRRTLGSCNIFSRITK